jgi:hypothetical protein
MRILAGDAQKSSDVEIDLQNVQNLCCGQRLVKASHLKMVQSLEIHRVVCGGLGAFVSACLLVWPTNVRLHLLESHRDT